MGQVYYKEYHKQPAVHFQNTWNIWDFVHCFVVLK